MKRQNTFLSTTKYVRSFAAFAIASICCDIGIAMNNTLKSEMRNTKYDLQAKAFVPRTKQIGQLNDFQKLTSRDGIIPQNSPVFEFLSMLLLNLATENAVWNHLDFEPIYQKHFDFNKLSFYGTENINYKSRVCVSPGLSKDEANTLLRRFCNDIAGVIFEGLSEIKTFKDKEENIHFKFNIPTENGDYWVFDPASGIIKKNGPSCLHLLIKRSYFNEIKSADTDMKIAAANIVDLYVD